VCCPTGDSCSSYWGAPVCSNLAGCPKERRCGPRCCLPGEACRIGTYALAFDVKWCSATEQSCPGPGHTLCQGTKKGKSYNVCCLDTAQTCVPAPPGYIASCASLPASASPTGAEIEEEDASGQ
jgi:hypothetical protein